MCFCVVVLFVEGSHLLLLLYRVVYVVELVRTRARLGCRDAGKDSFKKTIPAGFLTNLL